MLCLVVEESSVSLVLDELDVCFLAPFGFDGMHTSSEEVPFLRVVVFFDFGIVQFVTHLALLKYSSFS